ncbi:MAG: histidine kinase, partial [Bacteroidota bacterium]
MLTSWWAFFVPLLGQPEVDTLARPQVQYLGLEQGLPNRVVYGSTFDKTDLLWLSTGNGLCRYDGYQVNLFTNAPQQYGGPLWCSPTGVIFSLLREYPDSIEIFAPTTLQASGAKLSALAEGHFSGARVGADHQLYFAAGAFVYRFDPVLRSATQIHQLDAETREGDRLLYADAEDYLLYRSGSHTLSGSRERDTPLPTPGPAVVLHQDRTGNLWYADERGSFYQRRPGSSVFTPGPQLPGGESVNFLNEDASGNLILGHFRDYFRRFSDLLRLDVDGIQTDLRWLLADVEDRIIHFSGADFRQEIQLNTFGGLVFIRPAQKRDPIFRNFLEHELPPGKFGHVMRGFTADDAGNVYVNKDSRQPWWFRVAAGSLDLDTLIMQDNHGQPADQFGCGTELINYRGDIYGMSCYRAKTDTSHVYRYRPANESWRRWQIPELDQVARWIMPGRSEDELLVLTQDAKTDKHGLLYAFYPERGAFEQILPAGPELFLAGWPKVALKDTARQAYWIGTTDGLYRFDYREDRLRRYQFPDGKRTVVSDLHLYPSGVLWLGTFSNGLHGFEPEKEVFSHIGGIIAEGQPTPNPQEFMVLPSDDIAGLAVTPEQGLLITTFNGMVYHSSTGSAVFTAADGLPNSEFNTPSLFRNPTDNRWYAGGVNGFTSFLLADLRADASPYEPAFLRYRILDRGLGHETIHSLPPHHPPSLTLAPSVSYLTLEFTMPDFTAAGPIRYQTQLVGFDPGWRAPTTTPNVRYTRLPAGNYLFQLKATDGQGRESTILRQIQITVLRPWYQQLWFFLLVLFLAALATYLFFQYQLRRKTERMEAERRVLSLELRSLRQQLNPHFLSNAMNAIRETIRRKEPAKASEYLLDFNRLMRLFLESSRKRYTPLAEEVEMLRKYVKL